LCYGRSSLLRERLLAAAELLVAVDEPSSVVIDPDSRLTQLGLLPIGEDDSRYYFFESRAFGGELEVSLPRLMAQWLAEVFDIEDARPYVAPLPEPRVADITVSWGVGENAQKRMDDDFEIEVLAAVLASGRPVLLDRGAGGEEAERIDRLAQRLGNPPNLHIHDGSYGSFAGHIVQSRLYIGYDSAGQHVAAAAGVPLVSVFKGYVCPRMLSRWKPDSPCARVVVVEEGQENELVLQRTLRAIAEAEVGALGASMG
jgi:hypothetical protein